MTQLFSDLMPGGDSKQTTGTDLFGDLKPKYGVGRKAADIGLEFGGGVALGAQSIANVFGAGSDTSRKLSEAAEYATGLQSPQRRAEKQRHAQRMQEAEESGSTLSEIGAAVRNFGEAPVSTTAGALGSTLPTLAAAAVNPGLALPVGVAQGVGIVKGEIHEDVERRLIESGVDAPQAAQRARLAQAYFGENTDQIALGGGLGLLAGRFGVERAITGLGREGAGTLLGRTTAGAISEGVTEAAQGGQERLAANVASQREGFEDIPTWQGVAGQATLEGLAGAALGGSMSAATGRQRDEPPGTEGETAGSAPASPETLALPAPVYTGTPGAQITEADVARANSLAEAETRTTDLQRRRAEFEAQRMGINPADGPVSRAATKAVEEMLALPAPGMSSAPMTGIPSDVALLAEVERANASSEAEARTQELYRRRAQFDAENESRRLTAFTEKGAQRAAQQLEQERGEAHQVIHHPTVEGRFAAVPTVSDAPTTQAGPLPENPAASATAPAGVELATLARRGSAMAQAAKLRKQFPDAQIEVEQRGERWAVVDRVENPFADSPGAMASTAMNRLAELQGMASEAGWQERGGLMLRAEGAEGEVTGRTAWIPSAEWFAGKPQGVTEHHMRSAVEKVARGEAKMTKPERQGIEYMLDTLADFDRQTAQAQNEGDARIAELEAEVEALASLVDEGAVEALRERLAMQMEDATQEDYLRALTEALNETVAQAGRDRSAQEDDAGGPAVRDPEAGREDRAEAPARPEQGEAGGQPELLSGYTEADLAQREAAQQAATEQEAAAEREAQRREQADAERDTFTLTGSDRAADVQAAQGQGGLFDAPAQSDAGIADVRAAVEKPDQSAATSPTEGRAVAQTKPAAPKTEREVIKDLGEKVGGARKDTATSTGARKSTATTDDRPAWARRFEISQVVSEGREKDKWNIHDTRSKNAFGHARRVGGPYETREEAEADIPIVAVALKHRAVNTGRGDDVQYEIWRDVTDRKRVKVVDRTFETREEALKYMAEHAAGIIEANTTFGEADLPVPKNKRRVGVARREGDVKGDDFMETFGFRGVEFGNWNNQAERQELMNEAYDGLLDLAEVMNIPAKAISLNGDLALAFGARGHGLRSARAHYERDKAVINLTKMNGAGALAHEWFHALDHYFGRQDGKAPSKWKTDKDGTRSLLVRGEESDMASGGFSYGDRSGVRPEVREAYDALMDTIFRKAEQYVEDTERADKFVNAAKAEVQHALDSIRRELAKQKDPSYWKRNNKPAPAEVLAEFDTLAQQIVEGFAVETAYTRIDGSKSRSALGSYRYTNDTVERISQIYKKVRGRSGFTSDQGGTLNSLVRIMNRYSQRLKMLADAQKGDQKTKKVPTEFAMDAKSLDQGRGTNYWTTPHEMAARAFQGYVEDKIAAGEGRSPFLNYGPENAVIETPWGWKRPYPAGKERKAINAALDTLVETLETRVTEKGVSIYEPATSYTASEPGARSRKNDEYTQDLFGNALPDVGVPAAGQAIAPVAGNAEILAAGATEGAKFAVEAGPRTTGAIKTHYERVKSADQAAHTLAGLRKGAEEKFQVLVLDNDSRPVSVLDLFAGATSQISVYPGIVAKAVYETPGAAKIWYAHNHPSGNPDPSPADEILTRTLSTAFGEGTGIEVAGHIVIAGNQYRALDSEGAVTGPAEKVLARVRNREVKVTQRRIKKAGALDDAIESPSLARTIIPRVADEKSGVVFLDARNAPVAFLPMTEKQMMTLRGDTGGAKLLFGAAARSNASAAIVYFPSGTAATKDIIEATENIGEAIGGRDIRLLDTLHDSGSKITSFAETGASMHRGTGGVFRSFAGSGAATADTMSLDAARKQIEDGADAEAVRQETGWFKGADGKWRFEISDDAASLAHGGETFEMIHAAATLDAMTDGRESVRVGDMLDHPPLFAAYPSLADVTVEPMPAGKNAIASIRVHEDGTTTIFMRMSTKRELALSALLHELQHGIQTIEGFASGGNANMFGHGMEVRSYDGVTNLLGAIERITGQTVEFVPSDLANIDDVESWVDSFSEAIPQDVMNRRISAEDAAFLNEMGYRFEPDTEQRWYSAIELLAEAAHRDIENGRHGLSKEEQYRRLAGEVEARNTQTRQRMSAEQRQQVSPDLTADVSASDVIVVMNGKEMHDAPAPANAGMRQTGEPGLTEAGLVEAMSNQFPKLADAVRTMLERGRRGEKGGAVLIESADGADIAADFASRTGREFSDAVDMFRAEDGSVQGFFDPQSGLTFLVGPSLDATSGPAVLLHEMVHGQQRAKVDESAMEMIQNRAKAPRAERRLLDRVAQRMEEAGEAGSEKEAAAYIVEEAILRGRSAGFTAADSKLAAWIDANISKRIGDLVRSFIRMVRQWGMRHGVRVGEITIDDMVSYAMAGVERAARGDVQTDWRGRGSIAVTPADADIRFSRVLVAPGARQAPRTADAFPELSDAQRQFLNKVGTPPTTQRVKDWVRARTDRIGTKIRQGLVDRYAALKELDEKLLGRDFINTAITDSSWVLARMSSSASGALNAMMETGRIQFDKKERVITLREGDESGGLTAVLSQVGSAVEVERFMGWIAANRAEKLMQEGREHLFTEDEIRAGKELDKGRTEDGRSRSALYRKAFKEFQQYRDDVLSIAESNGVISAENRAMWAEEFYVPFYRVMAEEDAAKGPKASKGLSRQEAYKRLKGGRDNLNDLMENTLMNFHHLIAASLKNQAAVQAMRNAERLGVAQKVSESKRDPKTSTFVLEDGKRVFYQVDDPLVLESLTALSDPGLNNFAVKTMGAFKRLLTNMVTVTPQFIVANTMRDLMQATATTPTSKNVAKNLVQGIGTFRDAKTRAEMLASGGGFSFGHLYGADVDEVKASLNKTLKGSQLVTDVSMIPKILRAGWRAWGEVADTSENIARAATYAQNVKTQGRLRAAYEARDIMDFSQHGAWPAIRFLIRTVPFLNARMQGLDKIYRSGLKPAVLTAMGKGSTADKQAAARFGTVTGALTLATIALYLANRDDEEYRKLEDWQKDTYWFFRVGDNAFFLPKPFEVGAIATMAERVAEQFLDDKATGALFGERMKDMLMQTFAFNPVPQMFQPALDVYSNRDAFTGRPIETPGMDRLSVGMRARDTTTAAARGISAASRVLGDESPIAISPVQADHLIRGYFGTVGANAAGIMDTIWRAASGQEAPDKRWSEYQPIKRFYRDLGAPPPYTRYSTMFYDGLREANRVYADVRELQALGRQSEAAQLAAEQRDMLVLRKTLNAQQRRLSEINARIKMVRRSDNDGAWKRRELDRLNAMKGAITENVGKRIEMVRAAG